jgi:hypothetical protein
MIRATIIDGGAVWKIVVAVLIAGVGLTTLFGEAVRSAQRLQVARRDGSTAAVALNGLVIGVAAVVCAAAVVVGVLAMMHK